MIDGKPAIVASGAMPSIAASVGAISMRRRALALQRLLKLLDRGAIGTGRGQQRDLAGLDAGLARD